MSFYEEIADYYDYIFPLNTAQIDFVNSCIEEPLRNRTILDIGCGTGDLAIALSDMGFDITSIDSDAEMLKRAERKMKKPVVFARLDMREIKSYFTATVFDAVLCFGNTLVHLNSLSEVEDFCRQVKAVLKDSGRFLLQILNYDHILDHNITNLPLIENNIITFERYYEHNNLIAFRTVLTVKKSGKIIENVIHLYPLRKHELDMALKNAGFTNVSYYGDFDRRELKENSLPLVVETS